MKQGSKEWKAWRGERITSSHFGDVLAGKQTKRRTEYMESIIDNLKGLPQFEEEEKPWFQHGKDWEAEARGEYGWKTQTDPVEVPVIVHPKYDFISCSPDLLVLNEGTWGGEIKCHKSMRNFTENILPTTHKPQVQGSLWISGFAWWDFISYWRNEEGTKSQISIHRVYPDLEYFCKLETACVEFWAEVQEGL